MINKDVGTPHPLEEPVLKRRKKKLADLSEFQFQLSNFKVDMQNIFSDKFEEFLLSFSLFTTVPLITTTKQGKGAIECLNGIRVLAFMAVIFGHTYVLETFDSLPQVLGKYRCT